MAKKPLILKLKIEVANKLRSDILFQRRGQLKHYYWSGIIEINEYIIRVHFQYYCIRRLLGKVNYVDISDWKTGKQLTKKQLTELL